MKKSVTNVKYDPMSLDLSYLQTKTCCLMVEKGIRDRVTQAVKRYANANNKYMKDLYNLDEESISLQYMDANNLYRWAMVQNLPTHRLLWKKAENFTPEKTDELVKKDKRRLLLEVDLEHPKELHKNHNELPFLAGRMKIVMEEVVCHVEYQVKERYK